MNAIHDLPTPKMFGLDHDYSMWAADSVVTLCNVPWNSDYRDVWFPDSRATVRDYLENTGLATGAPSWRIEGLTYLRPNEPIKVPVPHNRVNPYNYLMVQNPVQPVGGEFADAPFDYYYFITGVTRLAGNTTAIYLQLDVWQTYIRSTKFGNCYIERSHYGVAASNAMEDYGRKFLTAPEGLDIGGEYEIADVWQNKIASARNLGADDPGSREFSVMIVSTTALDSDAGTKEAPNLESANGSQFENLPNGSEIYFCWNLHEFKTFMQNMATKPWVMQGIVSITVVPHITKYEIRTEIVNIGGVNLYMPTGGTIDTVQNPMKYNWRDTLDYGRYNSLDKLKVFPYTVLELTTNGGTPIVIKPENWNDPHATVIELVHFAPPSARMVFYPYKYNAKNGSSTSTDIGGVRHDYGEFLDMATSINNLPTFSVVNNGYMQYMAANVNSIAFQHQNADWTQNKALQGANNAFNQAQSSIGNAATQTEIGIDRNTTATGINNTMAGVQGAQGAINSLGGAGRNPIGAGAGVANSALGAMMSIGANNANLANQTSASRRSMASNQNTANYIADTNKSYAEFAANGDEANAIAGIQARVQDAKLTQPTTAGQVGGDAFLLAQYQWGYDIKVKRLHPGAMAMVGEFMLRYGYSHNRFGRMPADYMVMQKFTYWKLRETYITQSYCPEQFKQALRGIFEKGVTVWRNPNDMGNIDIADNQPLAGIVL